MPTRLRKVRRMRGSRTHGYGQIGQHRQSGQRGGHGNAGLHKHKWTYTVKYEPEHFGRDPFKPPNQSKPSRWINVGMLDQISSGKRKLNLTELGYKKLLGSGNVSLPYEIIVESYTERAKAKVEKAGGKILEAV
jgi:large subunit ribosomal protein L15